MFDIDKLFLSTLHYKKTDVRDKSGNVLSRSVSKQFKEGSEEYYANRLIQDYISLLKDSKSVEDINTRSMNYGDASIDNDTKLLTDIVDDIESSIGQKPLDPYDTYSLWRNTAIRDQFITGKFGIGPFALNNNNHILTMLYGVKFAHNPKSILGITGHESLCDHEDMYGKSIMSWLSGLINAHVDVAKDPYISRLNVNKYTYNLVNLMVRTGFGKTTFYFTTQPILKELAVRVNNAASAYGSEPNKSKFRRQKDAEEKFIVNWANEWLVGQVEYITKFDSLQSVLDAFEGRLRKLGTSKTALYESIFNNQSDLLRQVVKSGKDYNADLQFDIETRYGSVKLSMKDIQLLVYDAKVDFDRYSDAISKLVKYCKIDTKKQGKNISEQRDFMRGYNNLFKNQRSSLRKLFEPNSLNALNNASYISTKTENATKLFSDILASQLIEATDGFNRQCEDVILELPVDADEVSQDVAKRVSDAMLISIRSDFFNSYARRFNINIKGLVSGNNTIYDRLNKLKIDIQTKEEYDDMRNADGSIDNYLLNMLTSGYTHKQIVLPDEKAGTTAMPQKDTYDNAKFISTMTFMDDDSVDADEVTAAWEELLEDVDHPELQEFARDLIVYSFITNGGNGGSNNIFKYIPTSWLTNPDNSGYEYSYAWFMSEKLRNFRMGAGMKNAAYDDVILNNWTDNYFIPTVQLSDGFEYYYTGTTGVTLKGDKYVAPQTDIPIIIQCNPSVSNSRFVKIARNHDNESQRSVAIYKKVYVGKKRVETVDSNGKPKISFSDVNIYVLTDPKGQNFGGKNKIYEYGREDSTEKEEAKQIGLNKNLVDMAEFLGADLTSVESVLQKLIELVRSKQDTEGALKVLKANGIDGVLYNAVEESTLNRQLYDLGEDVDTEENQDFPIAVPFENSNEYVEESTYAVPEKSKNSIKVNIPVIIDTVDKEGFHEDEKDAIVTSLSKRENGYQVHIILGAKEYNINLDNNFNIINKTRFSEIYNYNDKEERVLLKDIIPNDILFDKSLNDEYKVVEETLNKQDESIEKPKSVLKTNLPGADTVIEIWAGSNPQNADLSNIYRRPFKLQLFKGESPVQFHSVEQAFQYTKFRLLSQFLGFENTKPFLLSDQKLTGEDYKDNLKGSQHWVARGTKAALLKKGVGNTGVILRAGDESYEESKKFIDTHIQKILNSKDGWEAKRLGGPKGGFNIVGNSGATFLDTIWRYGESVAEDVMKAAMKASFELNTTALNRLLNTGNATLTHTRGGEWSEDMPRLLMEVREELRKTNNSPELVSERLTQEEIEKFNSEAEENNSIQSQLKKLGEELMKKCEQ